MMINWIIGSLIIGFTLYTIVQYFKGIKKGKCSGCGHECSKCGKAATHEK